MADDHGDSTAQLVEVLFHGPTHFLEAFGQTVKRGESAIFSEAELYALHAEDRIRLEVIGPVEATAYSSKNDGADAGEPEADTGEGHDETHEEEA